MTDPPRPALGDWPDPADAPRQGAVTLAAPDGAEVRGILWTPASGHWRTAVALTHPPGDVSVRDACPPLAAAGVAVLAFTPRDVNDDAGRRADIDAATAHLRGLGAEAVVLLEAPVPTPPTDPVLAASDAREAQHPAARTEERGGRGRVVAGATAAGLAVGVGLAVTTGVLVWPVVGAVAGVGVGDLLAGGRR